MRVLIVGASGFIGSHMAAHFHAAGWRVSAAARRPERYRRSSPHLDWLACDLRRDDAQSWAARLRGVDAVINCAGVLQDGLGDDSRAVHLTGAQALFNGAEAAGVSRFIHISAVGVDAQEASAYARDKQAGETALRASRLNWAILRPSLVVARNVYGGTALIRALCGIPGITPVLGGDQVFRPVSMDDVCRTALMLAQSPDAHPHAVWDLAGPDRISVAEVVARYRTWLGFGKTRIWRVPRPLAMPAVWFGDLLGWLGVRTALRSNAIRQLDHDVEGDPSAWIAATGVEAETLDASLSRHPAGIQDRWHARLGFARPLARWVLGIFWILTGILSLTVAAEPARLMLAEAGFSQPGLWLWAGSLFDMILGGALLVSWRVRLISALMVFGSLGYLVLGSFLAPGLWAEPLGPLTKILPVMALALVIGATEAER